MTFYQMAMGAQHAVEMANSYRLRLIADGLFDFFVRSVVRSGPVNQALHNTGAMK